MTMTLEPRIEVKMRVKVRCTGILRDGRMCNHVVATVDADEWEEQRNLSTTLECRRCGKVESLSRFM